jgi:hypothetical protein
MHLQNAGRDIGTSAAATLQVQFGVGPLIKKLYWYIQLYISYLAPATGLDNQ